MEITFTFGEMSFTLGILEDFSVFVAGEVWGLCGSGGPEAVFENI